MNTVSVFAVEQGAVLPMAGVAGGVLVVQIVLFVWALRRLQELSHMRERLSRLADGLALLTDTTEAGLATIVKQLQYQSGERATAVRGLRADTGPRVVAAADRGENLATIAGQEALSESEVRLHLHLAQQRRRATHADATL